MRRLWLALAVGAAAPACSAPAPLPDLVSAERLERDGKTDEALAAYRAAQVDCQKVKPARRRREVCASALLGEAQLLEDAGRVDDAITAYAAIPSRTELDPPPSAQGLYRAGVLSLERGADRDAWTYLWRTVTDFPDEAFAGDAIALLLKDGRRRDARALWHQFADLVEPLGDTAVADNLLWALADLAEHEMGDLRAARELYDRIPTEHPDSGLRDDARWHGARLSRALGDGAGAAARLRALLATREVALGAGSYFSIWLDDAQLELGKVLRDDLGDLDGAIAAFRQLPEDYPASILDDDAAYEIAVTLAAKGDTAAACRQVARIASRWPDSRYMLELTPALGARLGCPVAPPPPAGAATATTDDADDDAADDDDAPADAGAPADPGAPGPD
ncbi:MAG: tetratricopeptide repeat protein [Kofleriaceae bacterium]|nr:tetratricopeptide repeat protein [Kofleriaceae bacterium]MCB9574163.1 tetratricopeptide repeat protein [Kofleriaceae bacterium]